MGLLRILLALAVVAAHTKDLFGLKLTGGAISVELFFIISGFYMTMILENKYTGKGSYSLFISNRFLRIYPIYWVVLGLTITTLTCSGVIVGNWWNLEYYFQYFQSMGIGIFLFQLLTNIFLFGQDIVMFLGFNPNNGTLFFTHNFLATEPQFWKFLLIPQAWTLSVELTFYLIAPFIVRKKTWIILCLILCSILLKFFIYFYIGWNKDPWTYRFFPTEIALFLLGTISYRIYSFIKDKQIQKKDWIISVTFLASILFYQFIPAFDWKNWLLFLLATLSIPSLFKISKNSRQDAKLGEYSYPVYIVHMLVILIISPYVRRLGLENSKGVLVAILSFGISYFLIKYVSEPIELIRKQRSQKLKAG
ncbi:acyltransferase [Anabaena sp. UHCC 0204]|uniref:acyltransferase family protein n=1 Tax=Anabaena sp. UHCC 0204 TaxID=2590009 RepID=UPI001446D901|nr:acyltransferase [Anabaena sp. UHCC 0204]MTJ07507.1 acyltransferase [Anabaena sp. UHCC 0204]